ncbi:MAG: ABC transporter ATP-binding protein [Caldilineaceae bacterium]|nr:ABC transporter ATP-binding protein [Caldilineaceae bacterium]MDE0339035.1 ABC transporter ATP-binding protein [Caldilineaceae bacterium]
MTLTVDEARQSGPQREEALGYAWRKGRGAVLRGCSVGMAWEATVVVVPFLAQRAIDEGLVPGDWRRLSIWVVALIASGVLTAVFSGMRHRAATQAGAYSDLGLRGRLFRHVLGLDTGFHDRSDRGDLLTRISTDVRTISLFIDLIVTWFAHASAVVLIVLFMLQMDLRMGLIGTAYIPLLLLLSAGVRRAFETRTVALREAAAKLTDILHENIFGVRVVRGFGVEPHQRGRYEPASNAIAARAMALVRLNTTYTLIGGTLPALAMVALLWWGGRWAISGEVTVGMLLAFSAWMVRLTSRTLGLLGRFNWYMQARASAGRVDALLNVDSAIADPPQPSPLPPSGEGLRFSNVSVTFGKRRVLDGISLDVRAGETVVLTGRSGSGKSILLSLPPRLYDPGEGGVFLDGVDVRDLCLETLRTAVCLASDDAVLFNDTIAANISLGRPQASQAEIEQAARLAQAHRFITEMPDGYDAGIGERGLTLSGGQRQRIALARAILVGPRLLLLDDASSSLDPATDAAIWQGLTGREQKRTMLVATQRRSVAARGDRVVLLDAGRIAAEGTDEELWRTSPLYRQVLSSEDEQGAQPQMVG